MPRSRAPSRWTTRSSTGRRDWERRPSRSSSRGSFASTSARLRVPRSPEVLKVEIQTQGPREIARRSRGTPRVANRLLRRVRDYAQVRANGVITEDVARAALAMLDVDQFGLDDMDARILKAIIEKFDGGPVGVATISAAIGDDASTLEEVDEPFLVQHGFLQRTARRRVATPIADRHFGYTPPAVSQQEVLF